MPVYFVFSYLWCELDLCVSLVVLVQVFCDALSLGDFVQG